MSVLTVRENQLVKRVGQRFERFLKGRFLAADSHKMNHKSLFIFPTKQGFVFFLIILVLWVLGTNYQNNLILALAFFMASLFVLAILSTYQSMNGLRFDWVSADEAFAGETFNIRVRIHSRTKHPASFFSIAWRGIGDSLSRHELNGCEEQEIHIPYFSAERGRYTLPMMKIESVFPFGIVRCWTWLHWRAHVVVYPAPVNGTLGISDVGEGGEADGFHPVKGGDDYSGLKAYVAGDPLRRIAWKSFARGRGLNVKEFGESLSAEKWIDFQAVNASNHEEKLSIMCFWVMHYVQQNEHFGVVLPRQKLNPNTGEAHRQKCLEALALCK